MGMSFLSVINQPFIEMLFCNAVLDIVAFFFELAHQKREDLIYSPHKFCFIALVRFIFFDGASNPRKTCKMFLNMFQRLCLAYFFGLKGLHVVPVCLCPIFCLFQVRWCMPERLHSMSAQRHFHSDV